MYTRPTEAKSIGGVLDDVLQLFMATWSKTWVLAAVGAIFLSLQNLYVYFTLGTGPAAVASAVMTPTYWIVTLAGLLIYVAVNLALIVRVNSIATGGDETYLSALARGLRCIGRGFLAMVVAISPVVGIGIVAAVAIASARNAPMAMIFVGVLLLVLLVLFVVWLMSRSLHSVFIALEDAGAFDSLSASRDLVHGNWWRTATILFVTAIIGYVVALCVQFGIMLLFRLASLDAAVVAIISQVSQIIMGLFMYPLLTAGQLSAYFDLKLRKEGDDLAARVNALASA